MKNKINATTVIKIVGWVATAVGGILVSLASDKQMQEQVDARLDEYISSKADWLQQLSLVCLLESQLL